MSLVFGGMGLLLGDGVVSSLTQAVGEGTSEATDTYGMGGQGWQGGGGGVAGAVCLGALAACNPSPKGMIALASAL